MTTTAGANTSELTMVVLPSPAMGSNMLTTLLNTIRAIVREKIQKQLPVAFVAHNLHKVAEPAQNSSASSAKPTGTTGELQVDK